MTTTGISEPMEEIAFIVAVLQGDATLATHAPGGVFVGGAPAKVTKTFVVVQQQNPGVGDVVAANPSVRVMHWGLWTVKVVGYEQDLANIRLAAIDLDRLLRVANGSTASGLIQACYRAGALAYTEVVNQKTMWNVGGIYECSCEPL